MDRKRYVEGLLFGGSAFFIWGLLPLYWRLVEKLNAYQLFSQRVVWSFVFVIALLLMKNRWSEFTQLLVKKEKIKIVSASALFISINWLTYIWAVNNHYVIESSLGYYINPLVLTLFGALFFKERLTGLQKLGICFAFIGVALKTLLYGKLPVIALVLAFSFAVYGLLKKRANLDSLTSLAFETLIAGIPSLFYLFYVEGSGQGITGNLPVSFWPLIALSGIVTATPLILYAESAVRLPLNALGFLQYISPTLSLILGIFVFKEQFNLSTAIAFAFILMGLVVFSYSQFLAVKQTTVSKATVEKSLTTDEE